MALKRMDNVGIVVDDLEAAVAFFAELGLELEGETTVEGDWADRVVTSEAFVAGDYIFSPKVYNEFSPGNTGNNSYGVRAGGEFNLGSIPLMAEASYERWQASYRPNA